MTTLEHAGLQALLLSTFLALTGCGPSQDEPVRPPLSTAAEPATKTFETAAKITPRTDGVVGFNIEIKNHSGKTISTAQTTCPGIPFALHGVNGFDGVDGEIVQTIKVAEAACDDLLTEQNDRQKLALGPQ